MFKKREEKATKAKSAVDVIWEKAGRNEELTPEEFEIYTQEVERRGR